MNRLNKPHTTCPYTGPDRRHFPRRTVQVPIELQLEDSGTTFFMETTDLSRNGCYVHRATPLSVGVKVQATLWLDADEVHVSGRIVTRHPEFGNGIMFLNLGETSERAIASYLEAIISEAAH